MFWLIKIKGPFYHTTRVKWWEIFPKNFKNIFTFKRLLNEPRVVTSYKDVPMYWDNRCQTLGGIKFRLQTHQSIVIFWQAIKKKEYRSDYGITITTDSHRRTQRLNLIELEFEVFLLHLSKGLGIDVYIVLTLHKCEPKVIATKQLII